MKFYKNTLGDLFLSPLKTQLQCIFNDACVAPLSEMFYFNDVLHNSETQRLLDEWWKLDHSSLDNCRYAQRNFISPVVMRHISPWQCGILSLLFVCLFVSLFVCLSLYLFGAHLLWNYWTDLAEVLHTDGDLSGHLTFWWQSPQGSRQGKHDSGFGVYFFPVEFTIALPQHWELFHNINN